MAMLKVLVRMLLVVMIGSSLAACGGEPVGFASLPTYPTATELAAGQNSLADTVVETMQSAMGDNLTAEVQLYQLPGDADFAAVRRFYEEQLVGGDWQSATELSTDSGTFSTAGWQRGGFASEQVLMLGFIPPLLDGSPVLIVSLFSE
ncbi:MAG: hypothetical protein HC822_20615 [Oscillochloris sp.]|nr:hypothetical protein [Oscillochloris sp.]